jgi:SAM-dependent methyltransferase
VNRFISIDEEGFIHSNGQRWGEETVCAALFRNLKLDFPQGYKTIYDGEEIYVEAFDHPIVGKDFDLIGQEVLGPYDVSFPVDIERLQLDEWDRITGLTLSGIRYVLNRQAQMDLFDQFDQFDDDSYQVHGQKYLFGRWPTELDASQTGASKYWDDRYLVKDTGWDLNGPHPAILHTLHQLKMIRSKILVLGCGRGHDAALLAQQGHIVTAIDFSDDAITQAQSLYGSIPHLQFIKKDVFQLPQSFDGTFDLVFEHTLYCALPPQMRDDLNKVWRRALHDQGHFLGILPLFERPDGPPYSSTEWELRQRLMKNWQFLYWTRSRITTPGRLGQEVIIYAKKNSSI